MRYVEPTGQLWEPCRCGQEPIYLPLEKCIECWPKKPNSNPVKVPLPDLTGSPRQVSWATDIRAKKIATMTDGEAERDLIESARLAKFWIENRVAPATQLTAALADLRDKGDLNAVRRFLYPS